MCNNKSSHVRAIFIFLAIFAFGAVLGLSAYMLSLKKTPEVIIQPDKPINPNPSDASETDISDWKTYGNNEFGFEFKYPPALILEEKKDEKIGWSNLSVFMKSDDLNGYILINDAGTGTGFGIPVSSENVLIGGLSSKLEILDSSVDNERAAKIYFNKDNVEYYWLYRFDKNDSDKIAISKKIFTTFKFIEKDETADWKTYRNEKWLYEIKIPNNWTERESAQIVWLDDGNKKNRVMVNTYPNYDSGIGLDGISKWIDGMRTVDCLTTQGECSEIRIHMREKNGWVFQRKNEVVILEKKAWQYVYVNQNKNEEVRIIYAAFIDLKGIEHIFEIELLDAVGATTNATDKVLSTFKFLD